jgi:hypothetical protein
MRVGDMTMLHQTPAPTYVAEAQEAADISAMDSGFSGLDARSQAMAVPEQEQPQLLEAQIEVDGQEVTREQYDALMAKFKSDDLHEDFMGKFGVAKVDGQNYRIPVREAFSGYMRNRDYSNGMAEIAEGRRENERTKMGFVNVLRDMDAGESFLRAVRALGKEKGFQEAAKLYAIEWDRERRMTPEQREMLGRVREIEKENYQLRIRSRQLEQVAQQTQQMQPSQREAYQSNQLAQMIPIASQRVGLEDSLMARQAFQLHWRQMTENKPADFEITTDFVCGVMQAAKEEVDRAIARSQAERAQLPANTPPVQRYAGAAPPAGTVQANGQPKRMRISDMNTVLTRQPGR